MAIDKKTYTVLSTGYADKSEAYEAIRLYYSQMKGITTYYDNGLWYIVQATYLM